MDAVGRHLLQDSIEEPKELTAPFFGFMGATAAIVFTCKWEALRKGRYILSLSNEMTMSC